MQVIAIRFNKASFENEETYIELQKKFKAALVRSAKATPSLKAVLSLEIDDGENPEQTYLLQYDQEDRINPDIIRNAVLEQAELKKQRGVTASAPGLAGTDPFISVERDGKRHSFSAVRILPHKTRASQLRQSEIFTGNDDHVGIQKMFGSKAFVLNLSAKSNVYLAAADTETSQDLASQIHDSPVGDHIRSERAKMTPDRSDWNKVDLIAVSLPNRPAKQVTITAQHLKF